MKCPKCGKEYSDKVCRIHMQMCSVEIKEENENEIKEDIEVVSTPKRRGRPPKNKDN